jgi:hypothetical protein
MPHIGHTGTECIATSERARFVRGQTVRALLGAAVLLVGPYLPVVRLTRVRNPCPGEDCGVCTHTATGDPLTRVTCCRIMSHERVLDPDLERVLRDLSDKECKRIVLRGMLGELRMRRGAPPAQSGPRPQSVVAMDISAYEIILPESQTSHVCDRYHA